MDPSKPQKSGGDPGNASGPGGKGQDEEFLGVSVDPRLKNVQFSDKNEREVLDSLSFP